MPDLAVLLGECAKYRPSDIIVAPGEAPAIRVDGDLRRLPGAAALSAADCKQLAYSMLGEAERARFEKAGEFDCAFTLNESYRLRINYYLQRSGVAMAMRLVGPIQSPQELGLTAEILKLCDAPRGLVLVTGPTGSGKSTTLAAMMEFINRTRRKHILTLEDPIEFVYQSRESVIDQREVGRHTATMASALKYAMRQDPDIILIGEMRDRETMELAIRAAETGHLCFSTLHTKDGPSTVARILGEFPREQRETTCTQLSGLLCGVVSQNLVPRKGGGRVCARGLMLMSAAVRSLIREDKVHQIYGVIEGSMAEGMCSMDQSLARLVQSGAVEADMALRYAINANNLRTLLSSGVDFTKLGPAAA